MDENYYYQNFNTNLTPEEEQAYNDWVVSLSAQRGRNVSNDLYTYDLRGAFQAGEGSDWRGHMTDRFKKPNHPTFSTESMYNGYPMPEGGTYEAGAWVDNAFMPSNAMLQYSRNLKELQDYFSKYEQNSILIPPLPLKNHGY